MVSPVLLSPRRTISTAYFFYIMVNSKTSAAKGMLPTCHMLGKVYVLTYDSVAKTNKEVLAPQPAHASGNGRNRRPSDKVAAQRWFSWLYGSNYFS
jgi:hypothetical protein